MMLKRTLPSKSKVFRACQEGDEMKLGKYLQRGMNVDMRDEIEQNTPLFHACYLGHLSIVKELIAAKANISIQNVNGETPLHAACISGHVEIVAYLLANNANCGLTNTKGELPLHYACLKGHGKVVQYLLHRGGNFFINHRCIKGNTPLMWAVRSSSHAVAELLRAKADVNLSNNDGHSPLHWACYYGRQQEMRQLLDGGADIDLKNLKGDSPLHAAVLGAHVLLVDELVTRGANTSLTNVTGKTPIEIAKDNNLPDCIEALSNTKKRLRWLAFSSALSSQQHQMIKTSPSLTKVLEVSDLIRYITGYMYDE